MGHVGQTMTLLPWTGGWNTVTNPKIADPQLIDVAENIEYDYDGSRKKRGGVKKFNQNALVDPED